jgi:RHS repeat-associated protein
MGHPPLRRDGMHVLCRWLLIACMALVSTLMPLRLAFGQTATTTTLTAAAGSAYVNQVTNFTVRVTGTNVWGTVVLRDGAQSYGPYSLTSGQAVIPQSFSTAGAHSLVAVYQGNSAFASSTSSTLNFSVVPQTSSSTTVTVQPTSLPSGNLMMVSATVSGSSPTGAVAFSVGAINLGTVLLNASGTASSQWPAPAAGSYSVTARYLGDVGHTASSHSVPLTVTQRATSTQLSVSANPSYVNQTVTLRAQVSGALPTGAVTFLDGGTPIGTANLDSSGAATLTRTYSASGSRSLSATYPGDTSNTASASNAVTLNVQERLVSTVTLTSSINPSYIDQGLTLSATVAGSSPTGSITFRDGSNTLGTVALTGGTASLSTSFSTAGTHTLTAGYAGDIVNAPATSSTLSQTVLNRQPSTTTVGVSPNPSNLNQSVTLTASVAGSNPTGSIAFLDGSTPLGTVALSGNTASLQTSMALAGTHGLSAIYTGDTVNAGSTGVVSLTVNRQATTTALQVPSAYQGQTARLVATVMGGSPTGQVTFTDGSTPLGSAAVQSGRAELDVVFASLNHSLVARYEGDTNHLPSASSATATQTWPNPPASPTPVVHYEYDANGNPTKTIQAKDTPGFNFQNVTSYDALNRPKDHTDPRQGKTEFAYNGREDLTQVTDPRRLVTQYPRNGLGDATQLVSPDTGTATHTYDEAGNLKTRTDSRGVLTTHTYDVLNRLTRSVHSRSGLTTQTYLWNYDQTGTGYAHGIGRLTSTTHPSGSTQVTYDPQGRVLTDIQRVTAATGANTEAIAKTVTYTYDTAGRLSSVLYPTGRVLSLAYANGRLSQMSLAASATATPEPLISNLRFEPFGAIKGWSWHLGTSTRENERLHDTSGRLIRYLLANVIRDISYDAADRITGYTHYDATTAAPQPSLNQGFGYDENGRLTRISTATGNWSLSYDANGNRTGVTLNGTASPYTTEATSNRLSSIGNPARSFGYDAAGNTTSDSGNYAATYDASDRLQTLTKAGVTTTYSYDGFGRRVRKFSSSGAASTVLFVYDTQGQLLGEYSNTGAALREYVWLGNVPIAVFTPNGSNPPLVYQLHTDHLNTPRIATDTAGNIRWRWMAEPFGSTVAESNPSNLGAITLPLRFPGQYFDQESGLHFNWHRYLDPQNGRYTQPDPLGLDAGDVGLYSYVFNQPTRFTDPDGRIVPAVAACMANPLCVAAAATAAAAIGEAGRRILDDRNRRAPPVLLDPGYRPGHWPPEDPPISRPESWPKDPKNQCIRLYALCKDFGWTGNCENCMRRCIAEEEWPFHLCDGPNGCTK